jgi:hypothetical protein
VERIVLPVAQKTTRSHIITETIIILNGHNFTVQYADSRRNRSALVTDWRMITQTIQLETGNQLLEYRDRVILHLSPRGIQSDRGQTLVASSLQFQMQMRLEGKDRWVDITPHPTYREEYTSIVHEVQTRLRKRGYVFD